MRPSSSRIRVVLPLPLLSDDGHDRGLVRQRKVDAPRGHVSRFRAARRRTSS